MKKHIFGLLIFGFIVSAAAIVYTIFNVSDVEEAFVITNNENYPEVKSCWRMNKEPKDSNTSSIKVNQAVLNLATKEFTWELSTPEISAPVALHFFSKDDKGTRYLTTETVFNNSSRKVRLENLGAIRRIKGKPVINLYVIAESNLLSKVDGKDYQPKFDATQATAVVIDYSETCWLDTK